MKPEPPDPAQGPDRERLKALLANSFHSEAAEDVPPLPDDLRERIRDQYGRAQTQTPATPPLAERSASFFAKLTRLFAQPAFRGAAAALVLIVVAAMFLLPKEATRGNGHPAPPPAAKIVILGFGKAEAKAIAEVLDPKAVEIVEELAGHLSQDGPTIVIDGTDREIDGYTGPGSAVKTVPLPDNPAEIAFGVAQMVKDLK